MVTGTDGILYSSHCELHRAACLSNQPIAIDHTYLCLRRKGKLLLHKRQSISMWGFFLGGKWRPQSISVALDAVCESRLLGTNLPPEAAFLGTRFRSPSNAENAPFLFSLSLSFSFASNDICSQAPVDGLVCALSRTSSPVHPIALGRTSGSKKKEKKKWEKEIVRLARIAHSESTWPVRRRRFVASNCIEQK